MPNQTLTIAKVEDKGSYVLVTDTTNKRYSGFAKTRDGKPTGLVTLNPGDEIEADITVKAGDNGKTYTNIGAFRVTAKNMSAPRPGDFTKPTEISGPEHGMAVKLVGDLYIAGKLKDDNPLVVEMFKELHRIMGTCK